MIPKKLTALAAILFAILFTALPLHAADELTYGINTTTDQDTALLLKYHGDEADAFVTVSAAGDLTFEITDSSTVDTSLECDASIAADGSRSGIYDVSVAACDTLGEICDLVNAQSEDWACVILDGLRSDTAGPAGTGYILAASDAAADVAAGLAVKWDTTAVLQMTTAVVPVGYRDIRTYYSKKAGGGKTFNTNLFKGSPTIRTAVTNVTSAGTVGNLTISSVALTPSSTLGWSAESATPFFSSPGAATTVEKSHLSGLAPFGIPAIPNQKVVVRQAATSTFTAGYMLVSGLLER